MTIKPTSDDGGTLLLFAALAVAAVALGAWTLRSSVDELPQPEPAD
jgi:hypothetical protein